jgi:hypothetical protein
VEVETRPIEYGEAIEPGTRVVRIDAEHLIIGHVSSRRILGTGHPIPDNMAWVMWNHPDYTDTLEALYQGYTVSEAATVLLVTNVIEEPKLVEHTHTMVPVPMCVIGDVCETLMDVAIASSGVLDDGTVERLSDLDDTLMAWARRVVVTM